MIRRVVLALVLTAGALAQERSPEAARSLARILAEGSQALAAGRLDEVDRLLAHAAPLGPDLRLEILGAELQLARKDAAGAASRLAEAIRKFAPEGDLARAAHRSLARALVELGRLGDASDAILKSFGLDAASAPALALAARGMVERGDRRAARAFLGVALRLDPARSDLLSASAALALEDGDPQAALRDAEALVARTPADSAARVLRARALHALGRAVEARDALAALDRVAPLEPALVRVLAALDLEAGLLAEAEAAWLRLGPLAADDAAALARAWLDRREPKEALRVVGAAPAEARLRAAIHLALEDGEAARRVLAALPDPGPDDAVALARAERISGRLSEAAKILEAVLAKDAAAHAARSELVEVRLLEGDVAAARRLLRDGLVIAPHHAPFVQALEDLVPELARGEAATIEAVVSPTRLEVGGAAIDSDAAAALAQLRPLRLAAGVKAPAVRLVVVGALDGARLARVFDLLGAAGFARVAVEAR
jgi:thioredoxin-like negative regulator of GroEL